ncbi:MAG: single-stranded DNA-binding protein [Ruminococcaceae bacterium]|nr:single-stranded DNA-binding protein [Oscillospiraceae bacterium]
MYNKAVLMGRICNDLELKTIQSGVSVLSFRLAVDRAYQAKGEERKADFFNIVAWRSTAEFISKYFSKGRMILVEGELQTRQYVDKNGSTQNVVELVVNTAHFTGEPKSSGGYGGYGPNAPTPPPAPSALPENKAPAAVSSGSTSDFVETGSDDDYPF